MAVVDNLLYTDIGNSLVESNGKKNHQYLYQQRYTVTNPLASVDPLVKDFYGPEVLTLLIISKNYGWINGASNWPQVEIESTKDRIKASFANWAKFKVLIWVDMVLANKILAATPDSDYKDQMSDVAARMEQICMEMSDYGFEYKGVLETGVDADYFQSFIDEFYGKVT